MARDARLLAALAAAVALCLLGAGSAPAASAGPLVEHWDGNSWTRVAIPGGGQLDAVAAISPDDVWAFGSYTSRSPIGEHWDGNAWHRVALPTPAGAQDVVVQDASADATDDVWLVGYWEGPTGPPVRPLVEHWDGTAWQVVPSATTNGYATLGGVSALSPTNVWAVGAYGVSSGHQVVLRTLVQHWNGTTWTRVASPNPPSASPTRAKLNYALTAVDATSSTNAWAVGSYTFYAANGNHTAHTLVLHWDGNSWTQVPSPSPGGSRHASYLYGVTAATGGDVWAVGRFGRRGKGVPLVEHWDGNSWHVVPSRGLPTSPNVQLNAVASTSGNDVWVAGTDYSAWPPATLVEHWDGTALSRVASPNPPGVVIALSGISADSPNDVWAVGTPGFP